jgi:hypothetical protein
MPPGRGDMALSMVSLPSRCLSSFFKDSGAWAMHAQTASPIVVARITDDFMNASVISVWEWYSLFAAR